MDGPAKTRSQAPREDAARIVVRAEAYKLTTAKAALASDQ